MISEKSDSYCYIALQDYIVVEEYPCSLQSGHVLVLKDLKVKNREVYDGQMVEVLK
jgi:hypothetical protein